MKVKNTETGAIFELVIQPLVWGLVIPETGENFSTMPSRSPADHGIEIVHASQRERELLERHGLLQDKTTLMLDGPDGPHPAWLDVEPALTWGRLGCLNAIEAEDSWHRVVSASDNDVRMLRLHGFGALQGLDDAERQLQRDVGNRDAA